MKPRILIVDDDTNNLLTLEAVLGSVHYDLHRATNGIDACRMAESLSPDLVLLDVMMPGMDGFSVCRHIRATPAIRSVPVILLTALNDQEARLEGLRSGADDFLSKPCFFDELRARVATIIRLNRFRVIAEQRTRFEHLFTLAPAAILLLDTGGAVVSANEKALLLFSPAQPEGLVGCVLADLCPDPAAAAVRALVDGALGGGATHAPVNLRLPVNGADRIFGVQASLLRESAARLVLFILSDVTAEVRAREEAESMTRRLDALVQARTRQLEHANELLMSYAAFVSHDLRSPLGAVQCYLDMMQADPALPHSGDLRQCLQGASSASRMMADMIRGLLQLAADEKNHAEPPADPVDPRPIIERLAWKIASFNPLVHPRFTCGPLPLIRVRPAVIERVFYNLLVNAAKYSATREQPEIEVGAAPTADGVAIFVRDNGIGFSEDDASHLFREFSRLPGSEGTEGLGLGLALVSRLLHSHRGRIWAEGRPGRGATFFVQFNTP
jgi:two-component system cell cycle sensor histidine kinase/response regulator CckA